MSQPTTIGDAERDATVTLLHAHMGAGHIDRAQLNQRLVWVKSARTQSELDEALAGLPELPPGATAASSSRRAPWRRVMLWMIALTPLLLFPFFAGWPVWWAYPVGWGLLYYLVYRADRASDR